MATIFNEDNTIEQMMLSTLQKNGWKYIPAEELPRMYSDVLVEPMVKEALIRLNPEIAEDPSRADEVIYKLRTLILSVQPHMVFTEMMMIALRIPLLFLKMKRVLIRKIESLS